MAETKAKRWLPLESNPEVINMFVRNLGMKPSWQFVDVFGLDPDLLCMIPQPVCALVLLFPVNQKDKDFKEAEHKRISEKGQEVSPNVYFTKQTVSNACGTVAVIHCIANNLDRLDLDDGYLKSFIDLTKSLSPAEKAQKLETDEGIETAHEASAQEGQTEAPSVDDRVDLHFVAFVHKDGCLYELDGRKEFPINHGKSTPDTFLQDGAKLCKEFMARDPTEVHFNIMALAVAD